MSVRSHRLATPQLTIVALILLLGAGIYLSLRGLSGSSPRAEIEAQLAQENLSGEALDERRVRLAIEAFTKERNRPPTTLQALTPRYLGQVPRSKETGEPIAYTLKGSTPLVGKAALDALATQDLPTEQGTPESSPFVHQQPPYDPKNKRDPFQPFEAPVEQSEDDGRPPLERYALSDLRLTAVIVAGDSSSATVEDSTGRGFIVRKGSRVGINRGEVTEIFSDRITIVETKADKQGRSSTSSVVMKLRTKEQEELLQGSQR